MWDDICGILVKGVKRMIRKCLLTNCALIALVLILSGCAAGEEEKKIDGLSELGSISVISR